MDIKTLDTYFENMAGRIKSIQHGPTRKRFSHYHIEEVIVGLRENLDMTEYCLLKEDISGQFIPRRDETVVDQITGAIMILKHVPHDDFAMEREVLHRSLKLAEQVAARMIADKEEAINGNKPKWLRGVNLGGFRYDKAQNLFDHCFGYRLEFEISSLQAIRIDPDEWI